MYNHSYAYKKNHDIKFTAVVHCNFRVILSSEVCRAFNIVGDATYRASMFTFLMASIHRFLLVVLNKKDVWLFQDKNRYFVLSAVWFVSLTVSMVTGFMDDVYVFMYRENCSVNWAGDTLTSVIIYYTFQVLVLGTAMSTLVLNICIVVKVNRSKEKFNNTTNTTKRKRDYRIAKSLAALCLAYYAMYVPWVVIGLCYGAVKTYTLRLMYLVAAYESTVAVILSPVLYGLLFQEVHAAYKALFACCSKAQATVEPESSTTSSHM